MTFEEMMVSAILGLYALVVTLYYRIGKLEQRLKDLITYYFNGGGNEGKNYRRAKRNHTSK